MQNIAKLPRSSQTNKHAWMVPLNPSSSRVQRIWNVLIHIILVDVWDIIFIFVT